ncbi:gfo/Idh/MocA family oxidoreductase [Candidatus Bathyarchaeota archaeon]|nr:MAG: gfo/Idh/MocA family oxidoreductase [Candidatus Bathyarchaeota archaeon]
MKKLGVAVIGVGFWGQNHARIYHDLPRAELVAVCDLDERKAREAAAKYGAEAYTDSSELLKREDVEAVSICTWSTVLADEASKALKAGKHVLVEKPMTASSREAVRLVELAEQEGLTLAVGFVERFNPGVQHVKELISSGRLGRVVALSSRRLSRWPRRPWDVGVVKDLAIHDVDLMRYLLGEEPTSIYAMVGGLRRADVEDYATILLAFPGGTVGLIEANWLTPHKVRVLRVTGSEATLDLDYLTQQVTIRDEEGAFTPTRPWREPLRLELEHFVDCVLSGREPMVSGRDGLVALTICELALKSASEGRPIVLKELP